MYQEVDAKDKVMYIELLSYLWFSKRSRLVMGKGWQEMVPLQPAAHFNEHCLLVTASHQSSSSTDRPGFLSMATTPS